MSNNSASGGYIRPVNIPVPGALTLEQFVQTVIVGITGYPGPLVRPRFQVEPPTQPELSVNWIAYGFSVNGTPSYAWVGLDEDDNATLTRQEDLRMQCAFYGPDAMNNAAEFRDGFQIQQNLDALRAANMGFTEAGTITRGPDLVHQRWVDRWEIEIRLARQVQRTYPILSFASAGGIIHTVLDGEPYAADWQTPEPPP